jgi:sterol-4alpha-carboxylate 3-dehydrogenase (decarboxylating)
MPTKSKKRSGSASRREQLFAPGNTPAQNAAAAMKHPPVPDSCFVTGGTGLCGMRLVEMLVERGAKRVVCFDIVPPPEGAWKHERIEYVIGDITNLDDVVNASKGADCVWHLAAAVGPFHPDELYMRINYEGTLNVLEACRRNGIKKMVMSTSPSTRMDGSDLDGVSTDELPQIPMPAYLQQYAASKAKGEKACTDANNGKTLMTVAVAPHQVYGPRDNLFLPNVLESYGGGSLRYFTSARTGHGKNRVCFTFVDNYGHALIIAERALYPESPALGKFYICTDGNTHPFPEGYAYLWEVINDAGKAMGFPEIKDKYPYPDWLLLPIAYLLEGISWATGKKFKLNVFNVNVLTMHRWFRIDDATQDLGYEPIVTYKDGWNDTLEWFRANWLTKYNDVAAVDMHNKSSFGSIASQSKRKIDIQAKSKQQ